jgi:hypothetical protein
MSETARNIFTALELANVSSSLIEVSSTIKLEHVLDESGVWIAIYLFKSNLENITIGKEALKWEDFAQLLQRYKSIHHILGIGNTRILAQFVGENPSNIHLEGSDVIDVKLTFLYSLWTIADVLKTKKSYWYREAELDIRRVGLKFFADNFNDLFERTIDPKLPLGEEDLVQKQKEFEEMKKRFPKGARKLPPLPPNKTTSAFDETPVFRDRGLSLNSEIEYQLSELSDDSMLLPSPRLDLYRMSEPINVGDPLDPEDNDEENMLKLMDMPLKSGLDGPVGSVVDFLLETVLDEGFNVVGIPASLIDDIVKVVQTIDTIIGIAKDFEGKSSLHKLFDLVKTWFPEAEEYEKYFDLFVDVLYALRSPSIEDILDIVSRILEVILPGNLGETIQEIKGVLITTLNMTEDLTERIQTSERVFDAILGWFNERLMEKLVDKFFNWTQTHLEISRSELTRYFRMIVRTINAVVDFVVTSNVTTLLTNIKNLIPEVFNILQDESGQKALNRISLLIDLTTVVLGYSSKPLKEVTIGLAKEFLPPEVPMDEIVNLVDKVVSEIDECIKEESSDIDEFKRAITGYIDALTTTAPIPEGTRNVMVNAITLVAGVMNTEFTRDVSQLPTLIEVSLDLLHDLSVPELDEAWEIVNRTVINIIRIVCIFKDDNTLKQIVAGTTANFDADYGSMKVIVMDIVDLVIEKLVLRYEKDPQKLEDIRNKIEIVATIGQAALNIVKAFRENMVQGIMQTLLEGVGFALTIFLDIDLEAYVKILEAVFPQAMGIKNPPPPEEAVNIAMEALEELIPDDIWNDYSDTIKVVLDVAVNIRYVFSDGFRWIFNQVMAWLEGKVEELVTDLSNKISEKVSEYSFPRLEGEFALDIGKFTSFGVEYDFYIDMGIALDADELLNFVTDIIFDGLDWEKGWEEGSVESVGDVFKRILSFVEIIPTFNGRIEITGLGSEDSPFMDFLLESLGLEIQFSGGAHFSLQLFSFKGGAFETSQFLKVIEWGFGFEIEISRDFTLLDLLSGGVGGGALNKLGEYIGLDAIKITIWFSISLDIIKRAASPMGPEEGTMTFIISVGAALSIAIDIYIASISLYGSIQVVFTFIQDLVGDTPLKIFMDIIAYVQVTISALFVDIDVDWGPEKLYSIDFTAASPEKAKEEHPNATLGYDTDGDGLSDDYESRVPGLNPNSIDTDGDGLGDKEETQTTKTDPTKPDTDGDGLDDHEEIYNYATNPKRVDTDNEGLTDYEEIKIYGTNPNVMDTDEDGLDDYYEVNHIWDISNCTTSVEEVWIGGVAYNDHTDPLNPDTDNDGLLDGEEGPAGAYYGLPELYNASNTEANLKKKGMPDDPTPDEDPVIFNYGYTHPLDNDTDDDSYQQWYNGTVPPWGYFLRSMTDGEEVKGIWVTFIIDGEPHRTLIRTNPCNPDTDGDTGVTDRKSIPLDEYLNSDGYELWLEPPTDPTEGDTDNDGLIDGLEGVRAKESNHTDPNNPDTDNDGLGDMQEILLGTDPRNADSDFDQVSDGDEYHRFHTNPLLSDSDFDGLNDGEEVWLWHTNPNLRDSDADGLSDGTEVLKHDTDPMDEDTDNDQLNDYDEIFNYRTDPFNPDTDADGLRDGTEVLATYPLQANQTTDPLNWDTDGDSIWYPNEYGEMTWPMSDGDEVLKFHTDPARRDTDGDGLTDAIELYLDSGLIPEHILEPIPLKPLKNDTDGDGILDGEELRVGNLTDMIYPYVSLQPYSFYNTSVIVFDTDNDGLSDFEEVNGTIIDYLDVDIDPYSSLHQAGAKFDYTGSLPYLNDTDGDTLLDGDEVFTYGTNPAANDTDGDGLADNLEIFVYLTDPNDPDHDDDKAPDGYEVSEIRITTQNVSFTEVKITTNDVTRTRMLHYAVNPQFGVTEIKPVTNPFVQDSDGDGILDGEEFDLDHDGVSDGDEFYTEETWRGLYYRPGGSLEVGGFLNSDSDGDGLSDGVEIYDLGTNPVNPDTDGDGYTDGAEVAAGTDPMKFTSPEEYAETLDELRAGKIIRIIYPTNTSMYDRTADLRVVNFTSVRSVWFRYNDGSGWSNNFTLTYNPASQRWENTTIVWTERSYHMQAFAETGSSVVWDEQWFEIKGAPLPISLWIVTGLAGGVSAGAMATFFVLRWRKKTEPRQVKKHLRKAELKKEGKEN